MPTVLTSRSPEVRAAGVVYEQDPVTTAQSLQWNDYLNNERFYAKNRAPLSDRADIPSNTTNHILEYPKRDEHLRHQLHGDKSLQGYHLTDLLGSNVNALHPLLAEQLQNREKNYKRTDRAPLGVVIKRGHQLPAETKISDFKFGLPTPKDDSNVNQLLHLPRDILTDDLNPDSRRKYILSHNAYLPTEQRDRHYDWSTYPRDSAWGVIKEKPNPGEEVRQSLRWQDNSNQQIIEESVARHRERTQHEIGKVHNPLAKELGLTEDMIYGLPPSTATVTAGDLIHHREEKTANEKVIDPTHFKSLPLPPPSGYDLSLGHGLERFPNDARIHNDRRVFGTPSIRNDVLRPKYRSLAETTNWGDEVSTKTLLNHEDARKARILGNL